MDERRGMHLVAEREEETDELDGADDREFDRRDDSGEFDREAEDKNGRPTETWRLLAEQLEPRIDSMSHAVEALKVAPYQVFRGEKMELCDPVNELRIKVEAVKWMLRIGKHLNGIARTSVMGTVSKSVEDLELVVETQARALAQRAAA
jgi:hypothetical protein